MSSSSKHKKSLVLGLGNDIMGDDAVGLCAVRRLREEWGTVVDTAETSVAGFALIDLLEGYEKVLLLDSIPAGSRPPGSVIELSPETFQRGVPYSPHYVGLKEVIEVAEKLDITFPGTIRILAMAIHDPFLLHEGISECASNQMTEFVRRAEKILSQWCADPGEKTTHADHSHKMRHESHTTGGR